jgi:ferredoxin
MNNLMYLKNVVTLELNQSLCNGCGMCVKVCPHEVFVLKQGCAHIIDRDRCMECGACSLNCSRQAIHVNKGVGCAAGILNGILRKSEPVCGCSENGKGSC